MHCSITSEYQAQKALTQELSLINWFTDQTPKGE